MKEVLSFISYGLLDFTVVLVIIEFIFCSFLKKRKYFYLRLLVLLPYEYFVCPIFKDYTPYHSLGSFTYLPIFDYGPINISYIVRFIITLLILYFCFNESIWKILFLASFAYEIEDLGHNLIELIRVIFLNGDPMTSTGQNETWYYYVIKFSIFVILILFSYFFIIKRVKENQDTILDNRKLIILVLISLSVISIFNYWTYYANMRNNAYYILIVIANLLLILLQFNFFLAYKEQNQKVITENVLKITEKQNLINKENNDIINHKAHDLKYQIEALKNINNDSNHNEIIDDLYNKIDNFDSKIESGNPTLDAILSEKNRLCKNSNIEFMVIANGDALSFMNITDLYVLFGNALDNAIEALKKVEENKRFLSLYIDKKDNITSIKIENYYEGSLTLKNGLPITSKNDANYHGFGVRSIQQIVEKYSGNFKLSIENNVFRINILFY